MFDTYVCIESIQEPLSHIEQYKCLLNTTQRLLSGLVKILSTDGQSEAKDVQGIVGVNVSHKFERLLSLTSIL